MKYLSMFNYFCPLRAINGCIQREENRGEVVCKDAEYNCHSHITPRSSVITPRKTFPVTTKESPWKTRNRVRMELRGIKAGQWAVLFIQDWWMEQLTKVLQQQGGRRNTKPTNASVPFSQIIHPGALRLHTALLLLTVLIVGCFTDGKREKRNMQIHLHMYF